MDIEELDQDRLKEALGRVILDLDSDLYFEMESGAWGFPGDMVLDNIAENLARYYRGSV